jgi:hypothetical protein
MKTNQVGVKIQGVKGGDPAYRDNVGYVSTFVGGDGNRVVIDAFEGYGESYKRRETPIVELYRNGNLVFSGSYKDLSCIIETYYLHENNG